MPHSSVVFQGPHASLRWPGTESGKLFYPAWNTIKKEDLKTGVSTQIHGTPNGDVWVPLETNTTLYDHFWFWSPRKVKKRKSLDELMDCYYKSVGYGSVFLLNASPDTTGLIPQGDMKRYKEFGDEVNLRFSMPLAEIKSQNGKKTILKFNKPTRINHVIIMEDYREGEHIREYHIDGYANGKWIELINGISVGRKKIDYFNEIEVEQLRLIITKTAGEPIIRSFSAYFVDNFTPPTKHSMNVWSLPQTVSVWKESEIINSKLKLKVKLDGKINVPGQYILSVIPDKEQQIKFLSVRLYYNGNEAMKEFINLKENEIHINQTAQITNNSELYVILTLGFEEVCNGKIEFVPNIIH